MSARDDRWSRGLRSIGVALILLTAAAGAKPHEAVDSIRVETLRNHIAVLSSDAFEGREAGTRGGKASGVYLLKALEKSGVRPGGDAGGWFQEFEPEFRNILAVLPGSDPELSREVIIVGAHYDHVGYGTRRNSFGPTGLIHNGADDNASGVAGLIEVARACAALEPRPRRTLLFAFWDAEEKGLLGSEHWVRNPTVPLESVRLMINADMIGRLRKETIEVYGIRTGAGLRRLVSVQNRETDLILEFNWDLKDDSDHFPFVRNRIPALMLHTMLHDDYHRPSDDADKIDFDGVREISQLIFRLAHAAAEADRLPAFREAARREDEKLKGRRLAKAEEPPRLGISWDGELGKSRRVVVTRVTPGSAAEQAGLRRGDEIVRLGEDAVAQVADFRHLVLAAPRAVVATVIRPGEAEPVKVPLTLPGTQSRLGISWTVDEAEPGCVILTRVTSGSPAAEAGLERDDRIIGVNGKSFEGTERFRELLTEVEGSAELLIERRGRLRTLTTKILPEDAHSTRAP